jgi:phospholipid/cholesterol/gamma-HCH transport system substrate-binding protein
MRRLILLSVLAVLACGAAVVGIGATASGSSNYQVDVIFDNAKGIISGQTVKVAGAKVGSVTAVTLTPDFRARISMSIDGSFRPFHTDAHCTIEPESLISENFLDCDPGTATYPPLLPSDGQPPTVPVTQTTEPVSVTDIFNIWTQPTAQRFTTFLNEAGAGFAGQGQNLNDIILRANPALQLARQAIQIATDQTKKIEQIISATDLISAALAHNSTSVQQFIDSAAQVSQTAADHSSNLALSIQRFPALLRATEPALQQFDAFARASTPVIQNFGAAAPSIGNAVNNLGPFSVYGVPALQSVTPVLNNLNTVLKNGSSTINQLAAFTTTANLPAQQLADLAVSLRDTGVIDNFFKFSYGASSLLSRFDTISHVGVIGAIPNACDVYAGSHAVPGCTAWFPNGSASPSVRRAAGATTSASAAVRASSSTVSAPLQSLLQYLMK